MYTVYNYKTKAALKEALKNGTRVTVYQPGLSQYTKHNGTVTLEGPHYPAPHSWYAVAEIVDDVVVKVK